MSEFDDFEADLSADIEAAFGDVAVLTPLVSTEFVAASPDPARSPRQISGVFSSGPTTDSAFPKARQGAGAGQSRFGQSASFWVSAAALASLPYSIRQGDRLTVSGHSFIVLDLMPSDRGDIEITLNVDTAE